MFGKVMINKKKGKPNLYKHMEILVQAGNGIRLG